MSDSPPSEGLRRRTVAAASARRPMALVGQPSDALRALLLEYGPCVVFPTITHFRVAERERWACVLILRASAWDAVLDTVTRDRRSIALVDVATTHEWPEDVARIEGKEALRVWLDRLHAPKDQSAQRSRVPPGAATRKATELDSGEQEVVPPAAPPAAPTRVYARPRSELLIVAKTAALRVRLFRALRGARPVRVVGELSELAPSDCDARRWLGVVIASEGAAEAQALGLVRDPCVLCPIIDSTPPDEAELKRWLLRAVAFEYSNHARVAQVLADTFAQAHESAYAPSIELAALYASTLPSSQRSLALAMTEHTWRWYAKESARILGESNRLLAQRALEAAGCAGPLSPSTWLVETVAIESKPFFTLHARVPRDVLRTPLSCVPWPDSKVAELARLAGEHDVTTVEALLTLPIESVGEQWDHPRVCDGLQEAMLATEPSRALELPHEAPTFGRMREALLCAMPTPDAAHLLRVESRAQRAAGPTSRALRFHERLLTRVRERLTQALSEPATMEDLRERDVYFVDVTSLADLHHFARVALRLPLFLSADRNGKATLGTSRPKRVPLPEFAELRGVNIDDVEPVTSQAQTKVRREVSVPPVAVPVRLLAGDGLVVAETLLREQGKPLTRGELMSALGPTASQTLYRMAGLRPFIEIDARTWGLIDRDVPGGNAAFDAAVTMLQHAGAHRFALDDALEKTVRAFSADHARWTREMIVAALRYARSERRVDHTSA